MFKTITFLLIIVQKVLASSFICSNGNSINASEICDGIANCRDSSDERRELCSPIVCRANEFKCYYGACVSRASLCNNLTDCIDGSDEFNCGKSRGSCE